MNDGMEIDIMKGNKLRFVNIYPQIKSFLKSNENIKYEAEITEGGVKRLRNKFSTEEANYILDILTPIFTVGLIFIIFP